MEIETDAIESKRMNEAYPLVEDESQIESQQSSWWSWLGWGSSKPKFTKLTDIVYPSSSGTTSPKHKLDIYIPQSASSDLTTKRPVLVHIHGGGWVRGAKDAWFYGAPATCSAFASYNFISVSVGYRTKTKFPAAIEDVADALAWVHENISQAAYGNGDPNQVFLSGHSAGGHLASLVTLNRRFLDTRNIPHNFIKGVISISGIYTLADPVSSPLISWGYKKMYIKPVFGEDPNLLEESSPMTHLTNATEEVRSRIPPFLVLNAASDLGLEKDGRAFFNALQAKGLTSQYMVLPKETHGTISRSENTMKIARDFLVSLLANLALSKDN